jgi:glyoxylase-like metal-dependent hydrolase (beta-lactamase superfamily II)
VPAAAARSPVVEVHAVGPLQCNCVIWADRAAGRAVVVDPGGDAERILARVAALGCAVDAVVHTHAHIDHVGATVAVCEATGAPCALHPADQFLLDALDEQASWIGLPTPPVPQVARPLAEGDVVGQGAARLEVLHTPGHTPGSLSFVGDDGQGLLVCAGDTLFWRSVGRTDLPGGDTDQLVDSIRRKLYALPDAARVIPGHGPATTIGAERRGNQFVRG